MYTWSVSLPTYSRKSGRAALNSICICLELACFLYFLNFFYLFTKTSNCWTLESCFWSSYSSLNSTLYAYYRCTIVQYLKVIPQRVKVTGFLFLFVAFHYSEEPQNCKYCLAPCQRTHWHSSFNKCILLSCNICSLPIIMTQKSKVEGRVMALWVSVFAAHAWRPEFGLPSPYRKPDTCV